MTAPDGPTAPGRPGRRRLAAWVALAVGVVALAVLAFVLVRGGDDAPGAAPSAGAPTTSAARSPGSGSPDPTGSPEPTGSSGSPEPTSGAGTSGPPASTGSPTIPGVVEDPATVPAARVLLCEVTSARITALLGPDGAGPDSLRIGSDALLQLLPDWRDGADGYPLADDRIVQAEQVARAWERATAAYDAGDDDAAEEFTQDAEAALAEMDRLDPLPGC